MKSDEEMGREKAASANHNHHKNKSGESRRMVDITRDKPIRVAVRVVVPVRDHPKFNFVGKLLGPKGNSLKRLQEDTMCKMAVLGRGSMKDRHKEEELRASGDPKFQHLSEELHVEISAFATPAEAHARIAYALAEVRRFLVPDYNDDIRQEQMWEMQVLSQRNKQASGGGGGGAEEAGADAASGGGGGGAEERLSEGGPGGGNAVCDAQPLVEGADSPREADEHPAMRGLHAGATGVGVPPDMNGGGQPSPTSPENGLSGGGGSILGPAGGLLQATRKRPLLAGGPRTSMTPTKRTVMGLLARARAAQAKQLPVASAAAAAAGVFSMGATPFEERAPTLVPLLREDYMSAVNLNLI